MPLSKVAIRKYVIHLAHFNAPKLLTLTAFFPFILQKMKVVLVAELFLELVRNGEESCHVTLN